MTQGGRQDGRSSSGSSSGALGATDRCLSAQPRRGVMSPTGLATGAMLGLVTPPDYGEEQRPVPPPGSPAGLPCPVASEPRALSARRREFAPTSSIASRDRPAAAASEQETWSAPGWASRSAGRPFGWCVGGVVMAATAVIGRVVGTGPSQLWRGVVLLRLDSQRRARMSRAGQPLGRLPARASVALEGSLPEISPRRGRRCW
jgi:hypothetical protein